MEELLRRNQALEEETVSQRHIIHLERLKTERESRDLEDQKNQLMDELEQEKMKLEEDIKGLNNKKVSPQLGKGTHCALIGEGYALCPN